MKSLSLLRLVGVLTLLISLASIPLYAQGQQPSSQDQATQSQPAMGQDSNQGQTTHIFVGKITKSKGDLVLKDDGGTIYKLDNTEQAKTWVGKTVKVTGTLDDATKTIHVTNMEAPSS